MGKSLRLSILLLATITLLTGFACNRGGSKSDGYTIAVIPKGTTHEFWKSIHAGAVKAERELNAQGVKVSIIWKGPLREDDREQQIQVVEGFVSQGVSGIVLAPLDDRALVRPVEDAKGANIPTVIIDSALQSPNIASFVATDNVKGGSLGADRIATLLGGKGKVLLLRYQEGSASTEDREKGFLERLKSAYPGVEVVSSDQHAGATRDTAYRASQNLLNRFANEIDAIFTVNETATAGMLLALQDINKAGKIKLIGFDPTSAFIDAMRNKQLDGLVIQDPLKMGYLGVKTMVEQLQGKPVEKRIDTGVYMITPDNLNDPDLQALIHPPFDEYLK
ncbi:MAG TPA: substrate-binding domain-containing protein [Blastocatellia bacterium]|nr:substrate-binding domain-containing protein [Blastocatellia bacterium]